MTLNWERYANQASAEDNISLINRIKEKLDGAVPLDGGIILGGKTMQQNLDIIARCNCCERHQTNRPRFLTSPLITTISTNRNSSSTNCLCDCRHFARTICELCE